MLGIGGIFWLALTRKDDNEDRESLVEKIKSRSSIDFGGRFIFATITGQNDVLHHEKGESRAKPAGFKRAGVAGEGWSIFTNLIQIQMARNEFETCSEILWSVQSNL